MGKTNLFSAVFCIDKIQSCTLFIEFKYRNIIFEYDLDEGQRGIKYKVVRETVGVGGGIWSEGRGTVGGGRGEGWGSLWQCPLR